LIYPNLAVVFLFSREYNVSVGLLSPCGTRISRLHYIRMEMGGDRSQMEFLYGIGFVAACLLAICMTPLVKRFAFFVGAVDKPNHRKVHTRIMPRLGGLAIFLAFVGAFFVIAPAVDDY